MKYKLLLILSLSSLASFSQNDDSSIGARSAATGHASVCLNDLWSAYNNQAGLANINNLQAGFYYEDRFLLKELSLKSFAVALPVSKGGTFGLTINNFGYELYNENKFGVAYSKKLFSNLSAGIQLDYLYTHIAENYGNKGFVTFEAGIRSKLSDKFILAAHVFNPVNSGFTEDEKVSSIYKIGLLYAPSTKVNLTAELDKDINYNPDFKAGFEYNIVKKIFVRTGISTLSKIYSFGFGFDYMNFTFDFASSIHQVLGYSPQFSMIYVFNKSK